MAIDINIKQNPLLGKQKKYMPINVLVMKIIWLNEKWE